MAETLSSPFDLSAQQEILAFVHATEPLAKGYDSKVYRFRDLAVKRYKSFLSFDHLLTYQAATQQATHILAGEHITTPYQPAVPVQVNPILQVFTEADTGLVYTLNPFIVGKNGTVILQNRDYPLDKFSEYCASLSRIETLLREHLPWEKIHLNVDNVTLTDHPSAVITDICACVEFLRSKTPPSTNPFLKFIPKK